MTKIKAFTIIELAISLLISSIVIGIAYYAFLFLNGQYGSYQGRSGNMNEYYLFKKAFATDFEKADFVTDSSGDVLVMRKNDFQVFYNMNNKHIVRQSGETTDSFPIENNGVKLYYVNDTLNLVKQVIVEFNFNNIRFKSNFSKQYSASQLIQANNSIHE